MGTAPEIRPRQRSDDRTRPLTPHSVDHAGRHRSNAPDDARTHLSVTLARADICCSTRRIEVSFTHATGCRPRRIEVVGIAAAVRSTARLVLKRAAMTIERRGSGRQTAPAPLNGGDERGHGLTAAETTLRSTICAEMGLSAVACSRDQVSIEGAPAIGRRTDPTELACSWRR